MFWLDSNLGPFNIQEAVAIVTNPWQCPKYFEHVSQYGAQGEEKREAQTQRYVTNL